MTNIPVKPQGVHYTDEQWQAIYETNHHLLVSASAGSGKTRILVQRVIEKLKQGNAIDELLVVTFTEAAAREMKERIELELKKVVQEPDQPDALKQHLLKQLMLLPTAHISTLHSFCLAVIRRYYYVIDLDPAFRLLTDATEELLVQEDVWTEIIEQEYEKAEATFFHFVENFVSDRSDDAITELIMNVYRFARTNPNPTQWLQDLAITYEVGTDLAHLPLYQKMMKPALLVLVESMRSQLRWAEEASREEPTIQKVHDLVTRELSWIEQVDAAIQADRSVEVYELIQHSAFKGTRYPAFRKPEVKELSDRIKPIREQVKAQAEQLAEFFPYAPQVMLEKMKEALPIVEEITRLTQLFLEGYQERKRRKRLLDFNDLEHETLAILNYSDEELAVQDFYQTQFKEVLVDEYQDINRLQQAILEKVSQNKPGNLFMVGDVKQSIYAFRLADPTLFIEKYEHFKAHDGGEKIDLKENFRSRAEVLQFTNLVFEQLMDRKVGQIDYQDAAKLITGATYYPDRDDPFYTPELLIYEKAQAEQDEYTSTIDTKAEGEIQLVAQKIRQLLHEQIQIFDRKQECKRAIQLSDIVLLTPTRSNHLTIMDIFKEYELPVEIHDAQNYFQAIEIQTMLCLLQIIDNPIQDIPLVSVLRSPLVGLTEEELVTIRLSKREVPFYQALEQSARAEETTSLQQKTRRFLLQLQTWRQQARKQSVAELLWTIYDETAYPDFMLGLPSGNQRYANLMALIARAETYEQTNFRGLYQFIRFIEKMQEKEKDLAEPVSETTGDAVKVMTIHASKGLEFPIVFLMDMTKEFNMQDFRKKYVLDEQMGIGIQLIDPDNIRFQTVPFMLIKQLKIRKALSEEMRKLYVALTRAEQKLYLVGSYKDQEATIKKWSTVLMQEEQFLDESTRLATKASMMDWVGKTLIRHPLMTDYLEDVTVRRKVINHPGTFAITWSNEQQIQAAREYWQQQLQVKAPEFVTSDNQGAIPDSLKQRLGFQYAYEKSTITTSYQSVSEIKRLYHDPDDLETNRLNWADPRSKPQAFRQVGEGLKVPAFMEEVSVTPTMVGQATHFILQTIPLNQPVTSAQIEQQIQRAVASKQITSEVAEKINRDSIHWFFESELGRRLIETPHFVHREQPFSMLKQANSIYQDFGDESAEVLIHGIVDGYIEYEEEIYLYDFKTDSVHGGKTEQSIVQAYQGQLYLYKQALEEALNKPVTNSCLVLLSLQKMVLL